MRSVITGVLLCTSSIVLSATLSELPPAPSLADHIHYVPSSHPKKHGWLADLTGLPLIQEIEHFVSYVDQLIDNEEEEACVVINKQLRHLIFQHFLIYKRIVNAQGVHLNDSIAEQWAHMLAMILKESSGDATNVTSMNGKSISTYSSKARLENWKQMLTQTQTHQMTLNEQTNFGLAQVSADRLFVAFNLAQEQNDEVIYLKTHKTRPLNSAIAIRRLIWLYQDFSQGRVTQSDHRIHEKEVDQPEWKAQHDKGIEAALLYCGTSLLFRSKNPEHEQQLIQQLKQAMASIAYCKLGNSKSGFGTKTIDIKCFAEWVTLCPALNIDIALLLPMNYFATRHAQPVCTATFKKLLTSQQ